MCHTAILPFMPYRQTVFTLLKLNENKHPVLFLGERKVSYQLFALRNLFLHIILTNWQN